MKVVTFLFKLLVVGVMFKAGSRNGMREPVFLKKHDWFRLQDRYRSEALNTDYFIAGIVSSELGETEEGIQCLLYHQGSNYLVAEAFTSNDGSYRFDKIPYALYKLEWHSKNPEFHSRVFKNIRPKAV